MSLPRLPQPGYFSNAKPAFLELIDPRGLRVLDLGCGGGYNGALLKRAGAREVVGVELHAGARVFADIRTPTLVVEEGAVIQGPVESGPPRAEEPAHRPPTDR